MKFNADRMAAASQPSGTEVLPEITVPNIEKVRLVQTKILCDWQKQRSQAYFLSGKLPE